MSDDRRIYARFYYDRFIADFPKVYESDRLFAAWMRLLVGAEKAWPNDPEVPRRVSPATLAALVEEGVVTVSGYHYRLRGYHAERKRRAEVGKAGANARWHANASANGHANASAHAIRRTRTRESNEEAEQGRRALGNRAPGVLVEPVG